MRMCRIRCAGNSLCYHALTCQYCWSPFTNKPKSACTVSALAQSVKQHVAAVGVQGHQQAHDRGIHSTPLRCAHPFKCRLRKIQMASMAKHAAYCSVTFWFCSFHMCHRLGPRSSITYAMVQVKTHSGQVAIAAISTWQGHGCSRICAERRTTSMQDTYHDVEVALYAFVVHCRQAVCVAQRSTRHAEGSCRSACCYLTTGELS